MSEQKINRGRSLLSGPLREAIREVRTASADREDVVVELRDAERMRLELFAQELASVIDAVPQDDQRFDFVINTGLQPRFWIDGVSHIAMGRDRRTYRFVRDTRLGRVVLAESADMKPVLEQVTRYIAERIVERDQMVEGDVLPAPSPRKVEVPESWERRAPHEWSSLVVGLALIGAGALIGFGMMMTLLWLRGDLSLLFG